MAQHSYATRNGGINVALFTPQAFAKKVPVLQEAWL